ncbi:MAG: sigma 54-interacting transcriptional regulator [Acidobacteriota bacterium]
MASREPLSSRHAQDPVAAGKAALEESRFEEAADHFRSALRMGARTAEEEATIRCHLSEALEQRGLYKEQLEAVAKYARFSEYARLSDPAQMTLLTRLGWSYSFNNDIPRAIALFNQAMQIARKLDSHAGMGACYFGLGRAYRNLSEVRIARDYYTSALEHYRIIGNWRQLAESYINIGYIATFDGDYRSALQSLKQALAMIGYREEHSLLGRAYMYLAVTYDHLGSTSRALAAWEKCIDHFRQAGNAYLVASNQNNLADKLIWLGQWARAEQLVKSAIEVLRHTSIITSYGGALDTLAQLYLLQGKIEEADRLLEECLEVLSPVKAGEWGLLSTRITIGRSHIVKGRADLAIDPLEEVIETCERTGDHRYIVDAKLWLAEALLATGQAERANELVESVSSFLRDSPTMLGWGLMMRMVAKVESARGHLASAIQSLGQSTSIFELNGNVYACAVNRIIYAGMLERLGRVPEAINEIESAKASFDRLGAAIDSRTTGELLDRIKERLLEVKPEPPSINVRAQEAGATLDLASAMDGFIAQRLVRASVMRELLLHELASIVRSQAASRAALIVEIGREEDASGQRGGIRIAASVGLSEREQREELELLKRIEAQDYARYFIYSFTDNQQSNFLLRIVEPRAERFLERAVNLAPALSLVEQGLESELLRSKSRRAQVFNPARFLARVELPGFLCASRAMSRVLEQIDKIRSSDVTVLITGESGTGKELVARAVHAGSSRRFNLFLPFNCSAAPRDMIESQLFGYRKGAFTGAIQSNPGIIRSVERGTLLLDEIGDLPVDLQPKLLRFLQEGEVFPIGENHPVHVDVRVIASTNAELERAVVEGRFREDLFHRLNVIRIQVPPLRERREEIPALINHYLTLYQKDSAKREIQLAEETVDLMVVYDWPGNVRQLCNEVRRIVAYSESGSVVEPDTLSAEIVRAGREMQTALASPRAEVTGTAPVAEGVTLAQAVEEIERRMIQEALHRSRGNIARAAKDLGLSRKGLYLKMDRLNFRI